MKPAWLVPAVLLVVSGVASAQPDNRPAPAPAPAPAPDGPGTRPRAVASDNRRTVGVLEVRVEGLPDDVKENFQRLLEEQSDGKQYVLWSRARIKQLMQRSTRWTEGCTVGPCLTEVRTQTGAELVLLAALTGSGTSFGYVVTLVRTDTGRVLQQESERCDVCTVSEALSKATLATIGLLNNVPDRMPDEAAEHSANLDRAVGNVRGELSARERHTRRVGLAIGLVGVGALVVGGVLYAAGGDARDPGAFTAVGGAALAFSGVAVLTF